MKILGAVAFLFLANGLVSAQPYGSSHGFGNVVFPGGGHPLVTNNPWGNVVFPAGGGPAGYSNQFASGLGGLVSGLAPYNGATGSHRRSYYSSGIYAYPAFVGGYGGYGYGYGSDPNAGAPPPQSNTTVVVPPAQQQPVVINQFFGSGAAPDQGPPPDSGSDPNVRLYRAPSNDSGTAAPADTSYYLIAFKDHSIYSAVAYYVEGDTLHYFTTGNVHNQVSLSLVDRPLTEQLNHERNVDVKLSH